MGVDPLVPRLVAGLLLLLALPLHAGGIYKWTDDNGRVHFSDRPALSVDSERVEVKPNTYSAPPVRRTDAPKDRSPAKHNRAEKPRVIIYSASWCGVCERAKTYFHKKKIRYTEYDVEKSPKGRRDFKRMKGRGVPVILVGKQKMVGFNPARFDALYRQ